MDKVDFMSWVDTHYGATEDVGTAKMRPEVVRAFNHYTRIKIPEIRGQAYDTLILK